MRIDFLKKIIPLSIRNKTRKYYIQPLIYLQRKKIKKFYSRFIKKGDLIFDIGAFTGEFTKVFSKLGAKVVTVEPQRDLFEKLEKKFRNKDNIILINKGIAEKEKILNLYINEKDKSTSSFLKNWREIRNFDKKEINKIQKIKTTTLDKLIKKYGFPNLIKIDVEGFESKVLAGLSKKIDFISFEFSKNDLKNAKDSIKKLSQINKNLKINLTTGEDYIFMFKKWKSPNEVIKFIENNKEPKME